MEKFDCVDTPRTSVTLMGEVLVCPVCLEKPTLKPVYQCNNGHLLCCKCYALVKYCPLCSTNLENEQPLRNVTAEHILDFIKGYKHHSDKQDSFLDDLGRQLSCSICLQVPEQKPIYQCGKSHLICFLCYSLFEFCPLCHEVLKKENPLRNLTAERLMETTSKQKRLTRRDSSLFPWHCKYREDECATTNTEIDQELVHESCSNVSKVYHSNYKLYLNILSAFILLRQCFCRVHRTTSLT